MKNLLNTIATLAILTLLSLTGCSDDNGNINIEIEPVETYLPNEEADFITSHIRKKSIDDSLEVTSTFTDHWAIKIPGITEKKITAKLSGKGKISFPKATLDILVNKADSTIKISGYGDHVVSYEGETTFTYNSSAFFNWKTMENWNKANKKLRKKALAQLENDSAAVYKAKQVLGKEVLAFLQFKSDAFDGFEVLDPPVFKKATETGAIAGK